MSFDDVVRSALDTLPPHIAAALRNVAVVVDENAEDPDLYGLFDGVPLTEGGPGPGEPRTASPSTGARSRPTSRTRTELRDEIRITVLHELGHYFGLDEDRSPSWGTSDDRARAPDLGGARPGVVVSRCFSRAALIDYRWREWGTDLLR